ncbi:hypothetical protein LJB75_00970, partial [Bacteroidales bacterium OttesenSCG-928-L19]|nr:hypothetical protein [Bacteroidales bacterium OttesenSCG-928-L19]
MNTNNTTIVWNEQSDRIMAFRQAPNNIIFTNEDLSNNHCRDIVAKQSIATNGGIVIPDEMELNFRSGDHIVINPGFSVKEGVDFLAVIENIPDCG